jgi:hypothetical protein
LKMLLARAMVNGSTPYQRLIMNIVCPGVT